MEESKLVQEVKALEERVRKKTITEEEEKQLVWLMAMVRELGDKLDEFHDFVKVVEKVSEELKEMLRNNKA